MRVLRLQTLLELTELRTRLLDLKKNRLGMEVMSAALEETHHGVPLFTARRLAAD